MEETKKEKTKKEDCINILTKITPIRFCYIFSLIVIICICLIYNANSDGIVTKSVYLMLNFIKNMKSEESIITLDLIFGLSTSVLGFTLTILSIFGIGVSNATINISNSDNMNDFLGDILDIIVFALVSIIMNIIVMIIDYTHWIGMIIYLSFITTIIFMGIKFIKLSFVTFLMFGINLLTISKEDEDKERAKDKMLVNLSKDIKEIKGMLKKNQQEDEEKASSN